MVFREVIGFRILLKACMVWGKNIRNGWSKFASFTRVEVADGSQACNTSVCAKYPELYFALLAIKTSWFPTVWKGFMVRFVGTCCSFERLKIGRFNL